MARGDEDRAAEARAELERLTRDHSRPFSAALPRLGALLGDRAAKGQGEDRAEFWGRRIGRGLAIVVFVLFLLDIASRWLF